MVETKPKVDPTDLIIKSFMSNCADSLHKKLHLVFNEIFMGDELDFLATAIEEIPSIVNTAPKEATMKQIIGMWADKKLKPLQ
jgi:succinate dehydrogenase flavin-adding protein (antitoxin of CptAB toxin-antitoxin module)